MSETAYTVWNTDRNCPGCGQPRATNGRVVWCTNKFQDCPEITFDEYIKERT